MTDPNPFASPSEVEQTPAFAQLPPNKRLWLAYAIAPMVAPVLFAVVVFVVGIVWHQLNPENTGTPIGIILIPIISVTLGGAASYGVAGLIGMPIAFQLRRRSLLNAYTIHGAALLWAIVFAVCFTGAVYAMSTPPRPPVTTFLLSSLGLFAMVAPCILLSATTFWWIVGRGHGSGR